ncbi:hypothetical protein [Streptacidiphilus sp. EB129]|uniref:hypothetical protein n=1 Tax=Streptacidiphilus sp. EB129 TaxID=3156262 RepID=UPI0035173C31
MTAQPAPAWSAAQPRPDLPARSGGPTATADPVHDLLERHLTLCESAVHPLEIAAELEAVGIGPSTAARYRHADVFSLAEELFARVPRRPGALRVPPPQSPWRRRARPALLAALLYLLPCAALRLARYTGGGDRGLGVGLTVAVLFALAAAAGAGRGQTFAARFGFAVGMAALLALSTLGGASPALSAALACGLGAAEWCARWFRHIGWGHLGAARSQVQFRMRMRPVLPVAVALYLAALSALTFAALAVEHRRVAGAGIAAAVVGADGTAWSVQECTGTVLLLVLLLWRCDRRAEALAALLGTLASVGVAAAVLRTPLSWSIPAPTPALLWGCGTAAALLLPYAWVVLLRPQSHRDPAATRQSAHHTHIAGPDRPRSRKDTS